MVTESNYIIAKKIDSGEYFDNSREWFSNNFLYYFIIRAYFIILLLLIGISTFLILIVFQQTTITKMYPFPIYALDQVKYFPVIKPISEKNDTISLSIARYLVKKYILLREEYKFLDQAEEVKAILEQKIHNLSSFKIYRNYINYMDPEANPDSPLLLYKNHTQRLIKILDVTFSGASFLEDSAIVLFEATEKGIYGENKSVWKAELEFNISDIEKVFKKQSSLSFIVTSYKTYKVS